MVCHKWYSTNGIQRWWVHGCNRSGPFSSSTTQTTEVVHSDVCGKIQEKSLGGGEYFLTFTDDKSRYTWVYVLNSKDQVFEVFSSGKPLMKGKASRSPQDRCIHQTRSRRDEGIRHETTTEQQDPGRVCPIDAAGRKPLKTVLGWSSVNGCVSQKSMAVMLDSKARKCILVRCVNSRHTLPLLSLSHPSAGIDLILFPFNMVSNNNHINENISLRPTPIRSLLDRYHRTATFRLGLLNRAKAPTKLN